MSYILSSQIQARARKDSHCPKWNIFCIYFYYIINSSQLTRVRFDYLVNTGNKRIGGDNVMCRFKGILGFYIGSFTFDFVF